MPCGSSCSWRGLLQVGLNGLLVGAWAGWVGEWLAGWLAGWLAKVGGWVAGWLRWVGGWLAEVGGWVAGWVEGLCLQGVVKSLCSSKVGDGMQS